MACAVIFATFPERPVRLSARTSPFHGGKTGSIPVRATNLKPPHCGGFLF